MCTEIYIYIFTYIYIYMYIFDYFGLVSLPAITLTKEGDMPL